MISMEALVMQKLKVKKLSSGGDLETAFARSLFFCSAFRECWG